MRIWITLAVLQVTCAVTVPLYNGTYAVDRYIRQVVDTSRKDSTGKDRRIMTSVFYPVGRLQTCKSYLTAYMPPSTAEYEEQVYQERGLPLPNGTFRDLELELCTSTAWRLFPWKRWPVALFSTGLGIPRFSYNAIASALSSFGYIVVTMDHPGQTDFIEYPDGSTVTAKLNITEDQIGVLFPDRVKDILFVLDRVRNGRLIHYPLRFKRNQISVFGHSFGGAGSGQAMYEDSELRAGINLDGWMFGEVIDKGLDRPFMIFGSTTNNSFKTDSWAKFLSHTNADKKLELSLRESRHPTFTDLPLLSDLTGLSAFPEIREFLGNVTGERVLQIVATYTNAWFKYGKHSPPDDLLQGPNDQFPEVTFVGPPVS